MIRKVKSALKKLATCFTYKIKKPVYIPLIAGDALCNRVIMITGATGGLGYAFAKTFLMNKATVIIAGRNGDKLARTKEKLISELSCDKSLIVEMLLDLEVVDGFSDAIESISQELEGKKIDTLVNNAGMSAGAMLGKTTVVDYDKTVDTNLKGTYFLSQSIVNYFIREKIEGNILNVSSVSGIRPAISPYMVSKWGINGLTKGMAKKYIKYGIVVNGIAPGPTATEMLSLDGENLNYDKSPTGRYADPIEIANLALFLIGDTGRMIVGETVCITGGCGNLTFDDIVY